MELKYKKDEKQFEEEGRYNWTLVELKFLQIYTFLLWLKVIIEP